MIRSIRIKNFGSICEEQEFSFEVPNKYLKSLINKNSNNIIKVTLAGKKDLYLYKLLFLFGSNGSGKTNIIDSFKLLRDVVVDSFSSLKPDEEYNYWNPYAFRSDFNSYTSSFKIDFIIDDILYYYEIEFGRNYIESENLFYFPNGIKALIVNRNIADNSIYKWGSIKGIQKQVLEDSTRPNASLISVGASLNNPIFDTIYKYFDKITTFSKIDQLNSYYEKIFSKFEKDEQFKLRFLKFMNGAGFGYIQNYKQQEFPVNYDEMPEDIREFVTKIMKKNNSELKNVNYYSVRSVSGKQYELDLYDESLGFNNLLTLFEKFDSTFEINKFLMDDEIGRGLHEKLLLYVFDYFLKSSMDSQLLCSSHNLRLLDCNKFDIGEFYFIGYDKNNAKTIVKPVKEMTGIRRDYILSKVYSKEKFGSFPDIQID